MKDVLFFDRMLTPQIILVIYWLLLVTVLLGGLRMMFAGAVLTGLGALLVGAVGVRIFCELLILVFKMNEALQAIRNKSAP